VQLTGFLVVLQGPGHFMSLLSKRLVICDR
jgi:hypothetical protein